LVHKIPAVVKQIADAIILEQAVHVGVRVRGDDSRHVRGPELLAQRGHHLC
jgi:hypothetical protein